MRVIEHDMRRAADHAAGVDGFKIILAADDRVRRPSLRICDRTVAAPGRA